MITYHKTLRFRSKFNLSLSRGRLVYLCYTDCLEPYAELLTYVSQIARLCIADCLPRLSMVSLYCSDFVPQIAWNHMPSSLPMYRRLIAYVSQIAYYVVVTLSL